ncbi:MAG: hemerythrin domain-containing protein [Planctomycetia bacterium]|nr:hemerythrin domain-containing protein [Planctomycetia bacterium]
MISLRPSLFAPFVAAFALAAFAGTASAHCDTVEGPVVQAGEEALESGDPTGALVWVQPAADGEVRAAFEKARAVRALSPEAREVADRWFLETLVRVHRAGEGEPFTGLKPAGTPVEPAIAAADEAVRTGTLAPLSPFVPAPQRPAFEAALKDVLAKRSYRRDDIPAGRAYVRAYVEFLHRLEHMEKAPAPTAAGAPVELKSPAALAAEHEELHERLAEAIDAGGQTAEAARALARLLHPHFVREEQIAMPPLALLPALAEGRPIADPKPALEMALALRAEIGRMLEEHVAIKAAMRALGAAAEREGNQKIARFSVRLVRHAETEEQVLYPTSLLVGRILEARAAGR